MFASQAIRLRLGTARRPAARERRVWVRQKCTLDSSCQPLSAQMELKWEAEARDLAPGGIGLVARRRFEPGTILTIEFQPVDGSGVRFLTARVIHSAADGEGFWRMGCQFPRPLIEEELESLL